MTRYEILQALSEIGVEHGTDYDEGLNGYFSWKIRARNGDLEITVVFEDVETTEEVYEFSWILRPTEVAEGGKLI